MKYIPLLATIGLVLGLTTTADAGSLGKNLAGQIVLQVESHGEAWYITQEGSRAYLGRPSDAFQVMRTFGIGATNKFLDEFIDSKESEDVIPYWGDAKRLKKHAGKIFLQVESHGEAWYINPKTLRKHYLGRPSDAFKVMRELGLGISNKNLETISINMKSNINPSNTAKLPSSEFSYSTVKVDQKVGGMNVVKIVKEKDLEYGFGDQVYFSGSITLNGNYNYSKESGMGCPVYITLDKSSLKVLPHTEENLYFQFDDCEIAMEKFKEGTQGKATFTINKLLVSPPAGEVGGQTGTLVEVIETKNVKRYDQ